jgi:pectate lyase
MRLQKLLIMVSTVVLAACGGGSNGSGQPVVNAATTQSADTAIVLKSGAETVVDGTIATNKWLLDSAEWQSFGLTPGAPDLTTLMRNADCKVATKSDQANPIGISSDPSLIGLGQSTWTCNLGVKGPAVTADTVYTLVLVGRDVRGSAQTVSRTLRVQP